MSNNIWADMTKKEILEDYTEYDRMIREHIKNFPKKIPAWNKTEDYDGFYVPKAVDDWLQGLKNRIGGYEKSVVTHEERPQP